MSNQKDHNICRKAFAKHLRPSNEAWEYLKIQDSAEQIGVDVMPDLIRHPEGLESTGFRLLPE
jgi:hypothetical protein